MGLRPIRERDALLIDVERLRVEVTRLRDQIQGMEAAFLDQEDEIDRLTARNAHLEGLQVRNAHLEALLAKEQS